MPTEACVAFYDCSVDFVDNLESIVVEFDWTRQCVPGRVGEANHRGRLAGGKQSVPIGRYIVEVHHAESSQRLVRVVESSTYARVDANGRRESGHHLEIDSLGRCFVRQEIC